MQITRFAVRGKFVQPRQMDKPCVGDLGAAEVSRGRLGVGKDAQTLPEAASRANGSAGKDRSRISRRKSARGRSGPSAGS